MSDIKERIIGALSIMSDADAATVWSFIQDGYIVKTKSWEDIEEDEPTEDELEVISKYQAKNSDYVPSISHEDLRKELNL